MSKHPVLKDCGIDGVPYNAGDIADVPEGSRDSAFRLGLIGPEIKAADEPETPEADPKKKK